METLTQMILVPIVICAMRGKVALECWSGQETREEEGRGVEGGAWHSNLGVQEEMHAQVQLEAEMLELMAEGFLDCSPECLQVGILTIPSKVFAFPSKALYEDHSVFIFMP